MFCVIAIFNLILLAMTLYLVLLGQKYLVDLAEYSCLHNNCLFLSFGES